MGYLTGIDTADDRFKREAAANLKRNTGNNTNTSPNNYEPRQGGSGGGGGGSVPSAPVLNTRMPLNRTPSGSVYAPDLSAYNDSSLFNYTGPGGAGEYTYGQNLPYQGAGYNIWGSPSDVANPYFWGQFATPTITEPQGPADAAINMPAIEMPEGVPGIGGSGASSTNQPSMPGFTGSGYPGSSGGTGPDGKDLTYQETLDYFGLNKYKQSTPFPGPNDKLIEEQRLNKNAIKQTLPYSNIPYTPHALTPEERNALSSMGKTPNDLGKTPNDYGLTWPNDTNNPKYSGTGIESMDEKMYSPYEGGEYKARQNYLAGPYDADNYNVFNNEYDLGRPGDPSYEEFVANPALFTTATRADGSDNESFDTPSFTGNDVVNSPPYAASSQGLDEITQNYYNDLRNRNIFKNAVLDPSEDVTRSSVYGGLDGFPGEFGLHNQEPYLSKNNTLYQIPDRTYGDVNVNNVASDYADFKGTEVFRPEGVEGKDFYEGNDGKFYNMYDDLNLEPLVPTKNNPLYQIPDRTYGDVNVNNVASDYADFKGTEFYSPRDVSGSVYDLPEDSYEREVFLGQIPAESTSNILTEQEFNTGKQGFLDIIKEGFESINAKYEGSTTDESAEAELGEIIGVIAGSYAANDEGTDTGELSTRDLVTPSLTYLEDRDGLEQALKNQAIIESIFTNPEPAPIISSGPSLFVPNNSQAQIKPSVAKTQNNMTVPIKRDEKLTARYGQPYRRYGL